MGKFIQSCWVPPHELGICEVVVSCAAIWFMAYAYLGCTDAAKWPPHPRPTRGRCCLRVEPRPVFFFFRFRIHADSRRFGSDARRLSQNRADSHRFGSYRPNTGVFRPEKGNRPAKKKKKILKTENTSGFDTPLSPSSLALTPFFFFFFFFASSPSSSFFLASPAFQFLLFL